MFHPKGVAHMVYRKHIADFEKRSVLLFAALTLGAAGAAFSQNASARGGTHPKRTAIFQQTEKNEKKNEKKSLTGNEAKVVTVSAEAFEQANASGDGGLTTEAVKRIMSGPARAAQ
jgi:uncharacterized protein HemX